MLFMKGLPCGKMVLDPDAENQDGLSLGLGSRWRSRARDMDGDYDPDNRGHDEEFLDDFEEDELSDEPGSMEPTPGEAE